MTTSSARRPEAGFTLLELMIVVAIIGIAMAVALPSWRRFQENQELRAGVRMGANVFHFARNLALSSNRNHIVLFSAGGGTDVCGNPLVDVNGNPVPFVVIDDGPPGAPAPSNNCCINPGEVVETLDPRTPGAVAWGVTLANVPSPTDSGGGAAWDTQGTSFVTPAGTMASGVLFRPNGVPVTFSNACNLGSIGSGGGALYVTNGQRDYSVVLTPIGAVQIERWDPAAGAWGS